tara:strand:+ start:292 stop:1290 length:999 start_codon:yes stop_codon:yes gene_type:complete
MTLRADTYSPKGFGVLVGFESTIGTKKVDALVSMDVDSVGFPSLNPVHVYDVRSGAGETAKLVDAYKTNKGTIKEISISGNAYHTSVANLLANITGDTASEFQVAYNHTGADMKIGTTSVSDFSKTMTVVIESPATDQDLIFAGCVCTSLSFSGDMGTEGGRIKYSATFKTRSVPELSAASLNAATLYSAGTQRDMTSWTITTLGDIEDTIMSNFTLNLEHDATFHGFDTSGNPEVIARSSEFSCTLDAQIVYNVDSEAMIAKYESGAAFTTSGAINCSNHATIGSVSHFGFHIDTACLTSCAFSEGDVMMLDTSWKGLALATGHLVEITCE